MQFADALKTHFLANPYLQRQHAQIWKILSGRDSGVRTRRIARMEAEVREKSGMGPDEQFDFSSINWLLVLQFIAAIMTIVMLIF